MRAPFPVLPTLLISWSCSASLRSEAQRIHIGTTEGYQTIEVSEKTLSGTYNPSLDYHWYHSQKVHVTQGGSSGLLLHGGCQKFTHTGELLEKGRMQHGLKHGEWRVWHPNGRLKRVENWRMGSLHGKQFQFNEKGEVLLTSRFVNGKEKRSDRPEKKRGKAGEDEEVDSEKIPKNRKAKRAAAKEERDARRERKATSTPPEKGAKVDSKRKRSSGEKLPKRTKEPKE